MQEQTETPRDIMIDLLQLYLEAEPNPLWPVAPKSTRASLGYGDLGDATVEYALHWHHVVELQGNIVLQDATPTFVLERAVTYEVGRSSYMLVETSAIRLWPGVERVLLVEAKRVEGQCIQSGLVMPTKIEVTISTLVRQSAGNLIARQAVGVGRSFSEAVQLLNWSPA